MASVSRRLIRALESGSGLEPSAALREAVDAGIAAAPKLIEVVMKRCASEGVFLKQDLADWIVAAAPASNVVLHQAWASLRLHPQEVLALFRGLPEQRRLTEPQIIEFLWDMGVKSGQPFRPELLRALGEFGSRACQPDLAELLEEYKRQAGLKDTTSRSLPKPNDTNLEALPALLVAAELQAIEEARDLCADALERVASRDITHPQNVVNGATFALPSATAHLQDARALADGARPGRALNALRHHLESICEELVRRWSVKLPEKSSRRGQLSDVLTGLTPHIEQRDKVLFSQMCGVNKLTDFGSHHSNDFLDKLTAHDVNLVLSLSERVHERFQQLEATSPLDPSMQ